MLSGLGLHSVLLTATTAIAGSVTAGNVVELPSDVSVSLIAEPTLELEPWDSVTFTISVTNNGPEVVDRLGLMSSFFVDELDVSTGSVGACEGDLGAAVSDFIGGYEYFIIWYPVLPWDPAFLTLDVGETRTCQFSMPLTSAAPSIYPFSFFIPSSLSDLDASNNSATVTLHRATGSDAVPIPALSPFPLCILATLLTGLAWAARTRNSRRTSSRNRR